MDNNMQVVGYSEDNDALYYFNNKDEQVLFPINNDVKTATWSLLNDIKKWSSSVAYGSSMDFEFPEKYGQEGRKTFDGIIATVYNK